MSTENYSGHQESMDESPEPVGEKENIAVRNLELTREQMDRFHEQGGGGVVDLFDQLGVEHDSGLVSFEGHTFRTDGEDYGKLYNPPMEGPIDPSTGKSTIEYDPNSPMVNVTKEDRIDFERNNSRPATISDLLHLKGIKPDTGLVRFKQSDEAGHNHWIYLRTDSGRFGEFYHPES